MSNPTWQVSSYVEELRGRGFAFVQGNVMNTWLDDVTAMKEWQSFVRSWDDLAVDTYLEKAGAFRRRRHAVFSLSSDGIARRESHQPHFQSKTYNTLQGGIERWFEPITDEIAGGSVLGRIFGLCADIFGRLAPVVSNWKSEVHQFRIEARDEREGLPTPEGVHRDGVDFVLVLLISRVNIASGTTTIHASGGEQLGSFTLTHALDAALVDDARVFHGVTPVRPIDGSESAHRDVLVVTLNRDKV